MSSAASGGGEVGLPESINRFGLQFSSSQVEVQDNSNSTDVDGFCSQAHEGATVTWKIMADRQTAAALGAGTTVCHSGQFVVQVEDMSQMVCGVSLLLEATGDWGASNYAVFIRRCEPLASQSIAAPPDSPEGTTCALEYSPASDSDQQCAQVCYRDNKVVMQNVFPVSQCSTLAAKVAGP